MIRNRWGLWMLLGLMTAISVLALPSVAGASAWGPGFSVSGPQDHTLAGDPAVVIDAEGNATYLWEQEIPDFIETKMVLRSRVYHADGAIGPVEAVTTTETPGGSYEAKVGIDGSGQVHVAWKQRRESCPSFPCNFAYKVMTVSLDGNGAPTGSPLTIQEYGFSKDTVSALSYAVNSAGAGVVGFQHHINGGGTSVMVFSVPQGGPATNISPTGASEELNGELDVAINSSGAVFATWLASTISGTVVEGALLGGSPPGTAKSLTPSQSFGSEEPGLAALIDGGGNGTAVFALYDIDSIHRVFTSRLNAGAGGGTVVGPAVISGVGNEFSQFLPGGAALEPDGSILVAWSREIQDSFITKLSPTGTVGAPVELTPGALQGWSPVLGLDPAGDGVVMLESGGGTVYSLEGAPIAASGVPTGPLVTLAQTDSAHRFDEASGRVAASTSGNAAVAWTVPDQELQSREVRGSIRDGISPAVSLSVPATAQAAAATVMAAPGEDANPITYAWSFGDGSTGSGSVVSHAFAAAGIYTVSVTATDSAGNSTSRQASIQVLAPASASGAGGTGPAVMVRPQTKILRAPPKQTRERTVEVRFASSQAGSSFECGLDAAGWKPCRSPLKLKGLAPGAHRLKVRATNSSGLVEAGGPLVRFQVLKPKR